MKQKFATIAGTKRFASRFKDKTHKSFYNVSCEGLLLSNIGMGLYKGEVNDAGDAEWYSSITYGVNNGINLFDTAIRYRSMKSEKILGKAIRDSIKENKVKRDEVFISTKGGLISFPEIGNKVEYVNKKLINNLEIKEKDIYNNLHSIDLKFIENQLSKSIENINLGGIDTYLIHNIEFVFMLYEKDEAYKKISKIFEFLEDSVVKNKIKSYGISSWAGFRRRSSSKIYVDIFKLISIAKSISGESHNFKYVEAPLSIGMPYIALKNTKKNSTIDLIKQNNINLLASAPLYEGRLEQLLNLDKLFQKTGIQDSENDILPANISFPVSENSLIQLFELLISSKNNKKSLSEKIDEISNKDLNLYLKAINLVRSTSGVTSALVGMDKEKFAIENLKIVSEKLINEKMLSKFWNSFKILN